MAWSRLQSKGAQGAGGTTIAVTYASNLTAGTKLIAAVTGVGTHSSTVKDGSGNAFTELANINLNNTAAQGELSLWAIDTPAGDVGTAPTITATFAANQGGASIVVQEVSGLATGSTLAAMIDGTPGTNAGTLAGTANQALTSPTYSSTASNEYLVALFGDDAAFGLEQYAVPSGFTGDANNINSSSNADCGLAYENSTGGSEAGGYTACTGANHVANRYAQILAAFKLGAAAATPAASMVPAWFPFAPGAPGSEPFTPWPQYTTAGGQADLLTAAATITATASATLVNAPAPWELPPQYAPGWFPGAPGVPATDPFTAWPLGETGVNSAALTAAAAIAATGAAALNEAKPLNAASTVTATGAAALNEAKPLNAATTVTATAAAALGVVKAGVTPAPDYPPQWFPAAPGAPGTEPFTPWPPWTWFGGVSTPQDLLNAPLTVTAARAAALNEAKPLNAATTVTATGAAALNEAKPLNAATTVTAALAAALASQGGLPPAVPQYAPAWFPSAPSAPGASPFTPWPPWTGSAGAPPIPQVNATSSPVVGDPDTSTVTVTDPRDGSPAVTDPDVSTAGVTDPRHGTPAVLVLATSAPGVSDG